MRKCRFALCTILVICLQLCLLFMLSTSSSSAQRATPRPTPTPESQKQENNQQGLLAALYRLVWPAGRYTGNLAEKANKNVEKSGERGITPKIYLVNVKKGTFTEWKDLRGIVDFDVSPDGTKLFYRKMDKIITHEIKIRKDDVTLSGSAPIDRVKVSHLYACTQSGKNLNLWVESTDGKIRLVRLTKQGSTFTEIPRNHPNFKLVDAKLITGYLKNLRSLRSDGTEAFLRNRNLLIRDDKNPAGKIVLKDNAEVRAIKFLGVPVWLKDSDFLIVSGYTSSAAVVSENSSGFSLPKL